MVLNTFNTGFCNKCLSLTFQKKCTKVPNNHFWYLIIWYYNYYIYDNKQVWKWISNQISTSRPHLTSHMNWFYLPLLPVNVQEHAKCVGALQFQFACLYFPPQSFLCNTSIHWNWLHLQNLFNRKKFTLALTLIVSFGQSFLR